MKKYISILFLFIIPAAVSMFAGEIHEAAKKGDISKVKEILETEPGLIRVLDDEGETPPHCAILSGHGELGLFLVRQLKRENVDLKNGNGRTLLHYAAYMGQIDIARLLLSKGADPGARDAGGKTPLHFAALKGKKDVAELLLQKGVDVDSADKRKYTPLLHAFSRGNSEVVEMLVEKGANVNASGMFGNTILHDCAMQGNLEKAKYILSKGADPNLKWYCGETPLHLAVRHNHIEIARLLLEKRADPGAADVQGNTPLHTAVFFGRKDMVELSTAGGPGIHKKNKFGGTPLHRAAIAGYVSIVDYLIKKGADVDTTDYSGSTPFTSAVKYGNKKVALLLARQQRKETKGDIVLPPPDPRALPRKNAPAEERQAQIWYLGGSGWAIKTKSALLVFDYWGFGETPDDASLANGWIVPSQLAGLKTYVFITHSHYDHYNPAILEWKKSITDITFIFGWRAPEDTAHEYFEKNKETRKIGGLGVTNLRCEDGGSAFLVEIDGLVLYHGGDYGGDYKADLGFLAGPGKHIDLAFIESGPFHREVCYHTILKLRPEVMFPMHSMGTEYEYKEFAEGAKQEFPGTTFVCAENRGDRYDYAGKVPGGGNGK